MTPPGAGVKGVEIRVFDLIYGMKSPGTGVKVLRATIVSAEVEDVTFAWLGSLDRSRPLRDGSKSL